MKSALLRILTRTLALFPPAGLRTLAAWIAWPVVAADLSPAKTTRRNVELCFPELTQRDRDDLVQASLTHTAMLALESGITFHWSLERLNGLIGRITGERLLTSSLADERGVLLIVPHFGNWEFLALYLGRYGLLALYDPPRQRLLDAAIQQARQRTGAQLVPLNQAGLKTALRTLKSGGLLGLLPDQVPERSAGIHVPFFGQPALTMTLVHRLILATNPVVLIASATRAGDAFDLTFAEADPQISADNPQQALSALNRDIEVLARSAPEQYQWEYRRFKSAPQGQPKVY